MGISIQPKHIWSLSVIVWIVAVLMATLGMHIASQKLPTESSPPSAAQPLPQQLPTFSNVPPVNDALSTPAFRLAAIDRPARLPDLRNTFVFYGSAERPDRSVATRRIQFGLRGYPTVSTAQIGEKVFLKFDLRSNKWTLSEHATSLSAVFTPLDPNVQVELTLIDEKETPITSPSEFHSFPLTPIPPPGLAQTHQWSIGSVFVDTTLLEHQGASWWGQDEVIREYGGPDMENEASRQRIQFHTDERTYALWATKGDCFVYEDDCWHSAEPGPESINKPLLQVKEVDDRVIHFQIWNPEGTSRCNIDLPRKTAVEDIQVPTIKIIGAKSKKQLIVDIHGKRICLSPDDWVVLQSEGPVLLNTTRLLDDYLEGRLLGDLLIFSGIEKVNGDVSLIGTFFDTTRTQRQPFVISMYRSWSKKDTEAKAGSSEKESSNDEDEDLESDDEFDDDFDEDDDDDDDDEDDDE